MAKEATTEQGFDDAELADIMNEIEDLEKEFLQEGGSSLDATDDALDSKDLGDSAVDAGGDDLKTDDTLDISMEEEKIAAKSSAKKAEASKQVSKISAEQSKPKQAVAAVAEAKKKKEKEEKEEVAAETSAKEIEEVASEVVSDEAVASEAAESTVEAVPASESVTEGAATAGGENGTEDLPVEASLNSEPAIADVNPEDLKLDNAKVKTDVQNEVDDYLTKNLQTEVEMIGEQAELQQEMEKNSEQTSVSAKGGNILDFSSSTKKTNKSGDAASTEGSISKMNFTMSGNVDVELAFDISGNLLILRVQKQNGLEIEMGHGMKFVMPFAQNG
ncbi:MAG: hypothetical protein HQK50_10365 [Oligoflexia bacterium]|nr:hypothetical protein [Oligoflexia bacterium]MBF0365965.1 hypothetical protein [Oligoflexia bacterium]